MASTAISIDLGDMADHARRHLASGEYGSMDEVVQEAIRALDREAAAVDEWQRQPGFDDWLREKVEEALANPAPSLPIDEAFAELRRRAAARRAAKVQTTER